MKSRYDYMTASLIKDSVNDSNYPDPLSFNYLALKISEPPKKVVMGETDSAFFWDVTNNVYGSPEMDDLVLTLNGLPHKNFLKAGDKVLFPSKSDILNSFSSIKNS